MHSCFVNQFLFRRLSVYGSNELKLVLVSKYIKVHGKVTPHDNVFVLSSLCFIFSKYLHTCMHHSLC